MLNFPPPLIALPSIAACSDINGTSCNAAPGFTSLEWRGIFWGDGVTTVVENPSSLAFFMGFHGFSCKGLVCIDLSIRTVERISFSCGASKPNGTFYTFHAVNAAQRHVQRNSPKVAGNMTDPPLVVFWCYNDPNFGNLQSFKPP